MYQQWFEEHFHEMSGAGKWFSGRGINLIPASEWETKKWRILIVRLSTARDTADSFTHQLLYQIAAQCDGVFADCAWLPPPEDGELFDYFSISWITGVVSKKPAIDFDCIAFSNSIVQELINIPVMLLKSGIPLGKKDRIRKNMPLLILGGANAINCGILLNDDPIVDAIFIGEDCTLIRDVFIRCRDAKVNGVHREEILETLLAIPGMILPDAPVPTEKQVFNLTRGQLLQKAPVFFSDANSGTAVLQISEGCTYFCTFCAECWGRKPYRETDLQVCLESALTMKKSMGLEGITLYSFNFNMHRSFKELLFELYGMFGSVGLKSQRLDGVADDPDLMLLLHAAGKSSITVGFEFRSAATVQEYLLSEILLRKGSSAVWDSLVSAVFSTGFVYYRDIPERFVELFVSELSGKGMPIDTMLSGNVSARLPVRTAVHEQFITRVTEDSQKFMAVESCLGTDYRRGHCIGCGACSDETARKSIISQRKRHQLKAEHLKKRIAWSNDCTEITLKCRIQPGAIGLSRKNIGALIAQVIMKESSLLALLYRGFGGSYIVSRFGSELIFGDDLFFFHFQREAENEVNELLEKTDFLQQVNSVLEGVCSIEKKSVLSFEREREVVLTMESAWQCSVDAYLGGIAMKYTRTRRNDGWVDYLFSKDSRKKKVVRSFRMRTSNDITAIEIGPDIKFDYNEFIRQVIACPTDRHQCRIVAAAAFVN